MGVRGRLPKPTAIRELEGNREHRTLNKAEPKPARIDPTMPEVVADDPVATETWATYAPILRRMRVLTEADGMVLTNLCLVHSALVANLQAMREMNKSGRKLGGYVIATKNGYLAINQFYANVREAMEQELKFCRELGLSPSARARMQVEKDEPVSGSGILNGEWKKTSCA